MHEKYSNFIQTYGEGTQGHCLCNSLMKHLIAASSWCCCYFSERVKYESQL